MAIIPFSWPHQCTPICFRVDPARLTNNRYDEKQPQVLRLRFAPLRMTAFFGRASIVTDSIIDRKEKPHPAQDFRRMRL
jgi:hypothetical protein